MGKRACQWKKDGTLRGFFGCLRCICKATRSTVNLPRQVGVLLTLQVAGFGKGRPCVSQGSPPLASSLLKLLHSPP